ncbi:hypothetical protein BDSB_20315 [Burkholderia dolosa PC543]|nr:hypothetical protein BDSB_20315 [Burkholderia dolosa PC543]
MYVGSRPGRDESETQSFATARRAMPEAVDVGVYLRRSARIAR